MKILTEHLENNYTIINEKLKKNLELFKELEIEVLTENKIFSPVTALDLSKIHSESINMFLLLELCKIDIPADVKEDLKIIFNKHIEKLTDLANAESRNNGNLILFMDTVVNSSLLKVKLINNTDNMIDLNFNESNTISNDSSVESLLFGGILNEY